MPSDSALASVDWTRRTEPADLPEWMDEPCTYEELRACLHDLHQVNVLTRGFRPTLAFFEQLRRKNKQQTTLRILDVGCGGGDALARIARWARSRSVSVELTGIDLNPLATRVARERYSGADIRWLTGDALAYDGTADVVLSSLLTHHLATTDVISFLRWMETTARMGWFVNDLHRSARAASLFATLARTLRWHRFVQHDGPVSFARSFARGDWDRMLADAGVPAGRAALADAFPARLCVSRFR